MVLLVLVPFLHGHLGASSVSGLHVDGLSVRHVQPAATLQLEAVEQALGEEESPAVGVSLSLPQLGDSLLVVWGFMAPAWCLWLFTHPPQRVGHPQTLVLPAPRSYASGWPPPVLAPPL